MGFTDERTKVERAVMRIEAFGVAALVVGCLGAPPREVAFEFPEGSEAAAGLLAEPDTPVEVRVRVTEAGAPRPGSRVTMAGLPDPLAIIPESALTGDDGLATFYFLAPQGSFAAKADAPRQARLGVVEGTIELFPGRGFEDALADLAGWDAIWVIYWMDRVQGWRPKVKPPRSRIKRGVFSTRAPHRPNPIGLSAVRLERVEGLVLHVRELDLLDGTPVLDLKPYIPWADAIPDARTGWLEREGALSTSARPDDPGPRWQVDFSAAAEAQLAFLAEHGEPLRAPIEERLSLGPAPHAYRRIRRTPDGAFVLAVGAWRARFRVEGDAVIVASIDSGEPADTPLPVHAAFTARFRQPPDEPA